MSITSGSERLRILSAVRDLRSGDKHSLPVTGDHYQPDAGDDEGREEGDDLRGEEADDLHTLLRDARQPPPEYRDEVRSRRLDIPLHRNKVIRLPVSDSSLSPIVSILDI